MRLHSLTPMLRTRDFPRALAFYTDVLGFACAAHDAQRGWASLQCDGARLMLATADVDAGGQASVFGGSLYFHVDAIDALWQRVQAAAPVCYALEAFEYGMREFAILDPDGTLLQFGEPVEACT